MKKNWFDSKVKDFSLIGGYQKPQLNDNSLKLDSNENYVLSKQFQNDIVSGARKNSDVREYPLGGVERLIPTEIGKGYRALANISDHGGQEVPHLHFHLFGGENVGRMVE